MLHIHRHFKSVSIVESTCLHILVRTSEEDTNMFHTIIYASNIITYLTEEKSHFGEILNVHISYYSINKLWKQVMNTGTGLTGF